MSLLCFHEIKPFSDSCTWPTGPLLSFLITPSAQWVENCQGTRNLSDPPWERINWILWVKFGQWTVWTGRVVRPGATPQVITQSLRAVACLRRHRLPIDLLSSKVSPLRMIMCLIKWSAGHDGFSLLDTVPWYICYFWTWDYFFELAHSSASASFELISILPCLMNVHKAMFKRDQNNLSPFYTYEALSAESTIYKDGAGSWAALKSNNIFYY